MFSEILRKLGVTKRTDEHERVQCILYATWLAINDTSPEDANLDDYQAWLESYGIPPAGAALNVEAIRRRLEAGR